MQTLDFISTNVLYYVLGPLDNFVVYVKELPKQLIPSGIGNFVNNIIPDLMPVVKFVLNGGLTMMVLKLVFVITTGIVCF